MGSSVSRRSFLKGLGAAGLTASLPMLPSLSQASTGDDFPQRLVIFFSANGTIPGAWSPSGSRRDFELNEIMEPLEPYKDELIIPEGLDNVIGNSDNSPGKGHPRGMGTLLTGYPLMEGELGGDDRFLTGWAGGPSIDHYIARKLNLKEKTTYPALNLGVSSTLPWKGPGLTMTYQDRDNPVIPENDVYKVFDRLFSDFDKDPFEIEKRRQQRRSVLDAIQGEMKSVKNRVSKQDRQRLDQHHQSIRDVEKRLSGEKQAAECRKPTIKNGDRIAVENRNNLPELGPLQTDVAVAALRCDMTRIATIQYNRATSMVMHRWLGHSGKGDKHHNLSHKGAGDSSARPKLIEINKWYAGKFRYLLEQLDSVPEGDGTMLDNTLAVWANPLGKGRSHTLNDLPIVMAGSAGGALDTGQYLQYDNRYHQDLWVTIAKAFGVETNQFGAGKTCDGALDEMLA